MAKWTNYYKIITPSPSYTKMTDSQEMTDGGAYNNYTWYQRLVQGSASRMTRYREYDLMDNDVEVSRALDTIAEEMTGNNPKTDEPLEVDILSEDERQVKSTTVLTLRAAVRKWCHIHDWENKLFNVSRMLVKYGDVFFRKTDNVHKKWVFVHPKNVVAAIVDQNDVTNVVAWQIKKDIMQPKTNGYSMPIGAKQDSQHETEIVDAKDIVRFTLNDDMSDTAPFGESVLRPVYRSHKQKELLEDAIIIYRVQRAPERRVFYIDVGKMPPQRVKQYLEGIKNEIKQKKIPSMHGGQMEVDSVYNPQSMCLSLDTQIPLLDGRILSLAELIDEYNDGKQNWVYSIDPDTGNVVPGPISWAGVTRKQAETVVLTLDNGDVITCTPDHKFPIQGKGFVEAKDITPTDSLWPFHTKEAYINPASGSANNSSLYTQVYNPATSGWQFVHRLVANYMKDAGEVRYFIKERRFTDSPKQTIHHVDFNAKNNNPDNLVFMNSTDHSIYHLSLSNNQEANFPDDMFARFEEMAKRNINVKFADLLYELNNDKKFMNIYAQANLPIPGKKYKLKTNRFTQKMFLKFIKSFGYDSWRDYRSRQIRNCINVDVATRTIAKHRTQEDVALMQTLLRYVKQVSVHNFALVTFFKDNSDEWDNFRTRYDAAMSRTLKNRSKPLSTPEASVFERVAKYFNYNSFNDLITKAGMFNHRIVKIEPGPIQDTGTLTIDRDERYHNYHTFALTSCFTKNSEDFFFASRPDGRGSRVETLPGGQGLGELSDLEYFERKVWRGLRVPASYMVEQSEGGQVWNDGKVGVAYIQELRFALFIARLQGFVERTMDEEFKKYLKSCNIHIDESMYRIRCPEPSNFGKYRQYELDSALLSSFGSADGIQYLSKRFILEKYLMMSDEEIIRNERLRREELGLDVEGGKEDYQVLYGEGGEGALGGGAGFGGIGGGLGGMEMGMEAGDEFGSEGGLEGTEGMESGGEPGGPEPTEPAPEPEK